MQVRSKSILDILKKTLLILVTACVSSSCKDEHILTEHPTINLLSRQSKGLIVLPEDHREGATWQLHSGYNEGVVGKTRAIWHGNEKGLYFYLESLGTGSTSLTFFKRKYTDTLDIKHFNLVVN